MSYLAVLGRQPELGLAELERLHGAGSVRPFSSATALVTTDRLDIERLGSVVKAGPAVAEYPAMPWPELNQKLVQLYEDKWKSLDRKQTLGVSVYGWNLSGRDIGKLGVMLKSRLKKHGVSLRVVPGADAALSSAVSHHNKLGLSENKTELLIVKGTDDTIVVAESSGAQNITALARRDQGRPKRDAFVGMLPPKLALTMLNLAVGNEISGGRILDPFCGTGVILQEALLVGFDAYGTDLSDKMIDYSRANIEWLQRNYRAEGLVTIETGDAMNTHWQAPVDAVASETYLGQPFSAPPAPQTLAKVRRNCNHIIADFLHNLAPQLKPGTPLCLAVPAWRAADGTFTHLPLISQLSDYGFTPIRLTTVNADDLIYHRPDQVVGRQLLLLERSA